MRKECSACNGKWKEGDGLCPVCTGTDFGLIESIPNKDTINPIVRQIIEYLMRENYDLRRKINDLQQSEDRWRGLVLVLCSPTEPMDEMNRLLVQFLSGPWKS